MIAGAFAIAILSWLPSHAHAVDVPLATGTAEFVEQTWRVEDGLPDNMVQELVLGPDGHLWIGTPSGLARFDGKRILSSPDPLIPELPVRDVRALASDRDGLWIGTERGLFHAPTPIRADSTRRIWDGRSDHLCLDPRARLWIASGGRLFAHDDGAVSAIALPASVTPIAEITALSCQHDGLWIGTDRGGFHLVDGATRAHTQKDGLAGWSVLAFAPGEGGMWLGTGGNGARLTLVTGEEMRAFGPDDGLTNSFARALAYDSRGRLWVGTRNGIFVAPKTGVALRFEAVQGTTAASDLLVKALLADGAGGMWAGTDSDGLKWYRPAAVSTLGADIGLPRARVMTVTAATDGLLVGTWGRGLFYVDGARAIDLGHSDQAIRAVASSSDGGFLVGVTDPPGVLRMSGQELRRALDLSQPPLALLENAAGIWAGLSDGLVQIATDGSQRRLLSGQAIPALARASADCVFAATRDGITRLCGAGVATSLGSRTLGSVSAFADRGDGGDGPWFLGAGGLGVIAQGNPRWLGAPFSEMPASCAAVEDLDRNLWVSTARGLVRLPRSLLEAGLRGHLDGEGWALPLPLARFEGLGGARCQEAQPAATRSPVGLLWFAMHDGLLRVDPVRIPAQVTSVRPVLESWTVDGKAREAAAAPLSPGKHTVTFRVALAGPLASRRVRMRVQLAGLDVPWVAPDELGRVAYHQVGPGRYRLQAAIAGPDGRWTAAATLHSFSVSPHWYQRWWARAGFLGVALGLIAAVFGWRDRVQRTRHDAILSERTRVAREIHDTLLQGVSALRLKMHGLERLFETDPAAARAHLVQVEEDSRRLVSEARQAIMGLRWGGAHGDFIDNLRESLAMASPSRVRIAGAVRGDTGSLSESAREHLFRIAREAALNAIRHGGASQITVSLTVDERNEHVVLEVKDDGKGFPRAPAQGAGGFGMAGMRERAETLGGTVSWVSGGPDDPGTPSTMRVSIPLTGG